MRPTITGRKCNGTLEAHQNGVRFTSTKHEILDVLYDNVKHAIYQPCDSKTSMVLVHFHLKNPIMVGKKKQENIQFLTEVVDSSLSLDASKRSAYDPDEIDEEQREREMRRRLNGAFKEFCLKLEKVATHYDHNLNVDVPFVKSSFEANVHREMVRVMPTTHCLVNLTETPNFCLTISDIEHVHFERAGFTTKAFDIVLIFKDWAITPKQLTAIDVKYMDIVQEWLNLVEITYTIGSQPMNWTELMNAVKEDDRFWYDTEADGETKKPHGAGWKFLNVEGSDDEEDEEDDDGDSAFSQEGSDDESEEESDDSDDSEFDEEDSDDEPESEDSEEEEGKDWDELERDAAAADKAKRTNPDEEEGGRSKKKARR
jgi:nucleosome binding factor SPN SPT16 subunit